MSPKILLRIAALCLLLYAIGHFTGYVTHYQVTDLKAKEVLKSMADTNFDLFGKMRSYNQKYTGISLNLIFALLTLTLVLWISSNHVENYPGVIRSLIIPISLCTLGFGITCFLFFIPTAGIICLISFIFIVITIFRLDLLSSSDPN